MSSVALLGWIFSAPLFYGLLLRLDGNATEADVYMNRVREILRRHRRRAMLAVLPRLEDGLMAILSEVNSRDELSQSRVRVG